MQKQDNESMPSSISRRFHMYRLGTWEFVLPGVAILLAVAVVTIAAEPGADSSAKNRVDALMVRKLTSAQKVLEGLATENFDKLQSEAARLYLYSQEAGWDVLQTEDYRRFSQDFRKAVLQVEEAAKLKSLDGASMGYIKLTLVCLECHKHVREVRGADR